MTLPYRETGHVVGVLSWHWFRCQAEAAAARANGGRAIPTCTYRAVRRGLRWTVIAYQNVVLPRGVPRRG